MPVSPDGKLLATGSDDGILKLWDAATGKGSFTLIGHEPLVRGVTFSPDGTHLASAGTDGTARVYTLQIRDLVKLAHSRVTRLLTTDECLKYLHMETCPDTL